MVGVDTGHPPPGPSFYLNTWSVMSPLCLPSVSRPRVSLLGHFLLEHLVTTAPWESKRNTNIFAEKNGKEAPVWEVAQFGEMSYPGG